MNEGYEYSGKGVMNITINRNTFFQESIDFVETMTTATTQGWPNVSGDEFVSALADATNHWLSSSADGWRLREKLMTYLSAKDAPNRLTIANELCRSAMAPTPITEHVKQAMRKEFADYLVALQRPMRDGVGGIQAIQIARTIADTVWVYGCRRNAGEAYLQTFSYYLSDASGTCSMSTGE